jgi:hypothetical protein
MSDTIYPFKVTLKEIQSPIWRCFQMRSDITFRELHNTLQAVMRAPTRSMRKCAIATCYFWSYQRKAIPWFLVKSTSYCKNL